MAVPKEKLTEWVVEAIETENLAVNANRDQMQRVQSRIVVQLNSALPWGPKP
jgi:hypothetical protein